MIQKNYQSKKNMPTSRFVFFFVAVSALQQCMNYNRGYELNLSSLCKKLIWSKYSNPWYADSTHRAPNIDEFHTLAVSAEAGWREKNCSNVDVKSSSLPHTEDSGHWVPLNWANVLYDYIMTDYVAVRSNHLPTNQPDCTVYCTVWPQRMRQECSCVRVHESIPITLPGADNPVGFMCFPFCQPAQRLPCWAALIHFSAMKHYMIARDTC